MEKNYGAFVGFATLQAHTHLSELLQKHQISPSKDIVEDAARFGQQKALEAMFPGLMRVPFEAKPLGEIILALRYQFEGDPEGVQAMMREAEESSVRQRSSHPATPTPARKDGTGSRPYDPSATSWRLAANSRNGDTSARAKAASAVPQYTAGPAVDLGTHEPNPTASRFLSAAADDESSRNGVGAGQASGGDVSQTRLKKIAAPPVFPWEKKKSAG